MAEHLNFQGRMTSSHQNNASDPVNLTLNYGYGFLEGACRKAINVGFLHDASDYQTKQSLVYDLQEPFRWLPDISVIEAFESETLKLSDFYFTGDDYRYSFKWEAKQRFIDLIREQFNGGTSTRRGCLKWDTLIEQKANELGKFLAAKSPVLDFAEPSPKLERDDSRDVRRKILTLTGIEARKLGLGKSTLHTLRKKALDGRSFRVNKRILKRLEAYAT